MDVGGLFALTVLTLATAPDPASGIQGEGNGAVLRAGDVVVTAHPAVEAVDHSFFVPLTLRAEHDGAGAPQKRVAVRLCMPGNCKLYERVELAVGTKERPAPVVHHRLVLPDGQLKLAPESDDAWQESPFAQLGGLTTSGRRTVALLGSFGAPVPSGGWRLPLEQGGMIGSVQIVSVDDALLRDPDLLFAYAGAVIAPDVELNPVVRTELQRYLRSGGVVVAPRAVADVLLPRIDPRASPEAVLDGERPLRPAWTPVTRVEAPPLATFEGQTLRPFSAHLQLPVQRAAVESGTLLAYDDPTAPVEILDALIAHDPAWASGTYAGPHRAYEAGTELAQVAAIPLVEPPPGWLFLLGLAAWAVVALVLLRRFSRQGVLVAVGRVAVLSAAVTGVVWGAARLRRTEAESFKVTVVQAAEGAGFGLEHGVELVRLPSAGDVEVTTPAGTHARPVVTGDDRYTPRELSRASPNTLRMPSGPDAPVGAAWSRPIPVAGTLRLEGADAEVQVHNGTQEPFDLILVVGPSYEIWSRQPLAPGETRTRTAFELDMGKPPADRLSAAAERLARTLVSSCRVDPRLEARQRCAIGVRKAADGLAAFVAQERP